MALNFLKSPTMFGKTVFIQKNILETVIKPSSFLAVIIFRSIIFNKNLFVLYLYYTSMTAIAANII